MKINKADNKIKSITKPLFWLVVSCVAYSGGLYATEGPELERVNSKGARVGHLFAQINESGFSLNGYLTKSFNRRGRIPGHVHVEIYDNNGDVVFSKVSKYHRHGVKARQSHFVENITIDQTKASTIRVTHHDLSNKHGCS